MMVPEGYEDITNDVEKVFISNEQLVITGIPAGNHNCDEMGCSSLSHVILRTTYIPKIKRKSDKK